MVVVSYLICENTFPAWIVLLVSIVVFILLFRRKGRRIIVIGIVILLVIANVGTFHLTNKISFLGGVISKVAAPIMAKEIGKAFTMGREETAQSNAVNAEAPWETPNGYEYEKITRDGYIIETLTPMGRNAENVIFQIHGGAFCVGITNSYRNLAVTFAQIGDGAMVVTLDYTTSEKAPYPAALTDCIDTYQWILEQGYQPEHIILSGDSAGGNLVLAMTLYLKDHGVVFPGGIITMSPVTDMHFNSESCYEKAEECVLGSFWGNGKFDPNAFFYTDKDEIDLNDPYLSPVFGDYTDFPPMQVLDKQVNTEIDMEQVADGTYTGSSDGGLVKVEVEVEVKDHKIVNINLLKHECGTGKPAESMLEEMVKKNTDDVDYVSGATASSRTIRNAVNQALQSGVEGF